jgi:hypothetical protein
MKGTGGQPHIDPASWGAYDRDSIMHYSSLICACYVVGDPDEYPQNLAKCVLLQTRIWWPKCRPIGFPAQAI